MSGFEKLKTEEREPFNFYVVKQQNRALSAAVKQKERQIRELAVAIREQQRAQETDTALVSCVERHWRQVEGDARRLLELLGDNGAGALSGDKNDEATGCASSILEKIVLRDADRFLLADVTKVAEAAAVDPLDDILRFDDEAGGEGASGADAMDTAGADPPGGKRGTDQGVDEIVVAKVDKSIQERCLLTRQVLQKLVQRLEDEGKRPGGRGVRGTEEDGHGPSTSMDGPAPPAHGVGSSFTVASEGGSDRAEMLQARVGFLQDRLTVARSCQQKLYRGLVRALKDRHRYRKAEDWGLVSRRGAQDLGQKGLRQEGGEDGGSNGHMESAGCCHDEHKMGGHKRKRSLIGAEAGADGNGKGEEGETTREAQLTAALDTLQELKQLVASRGEELTQMREEKMELNRRITSLAGQGLVDGGAGKSAPEKQEGGGIGFPGRLSEEQLVRQPLYQSLLSERDNLRRESQMKERQVLSLRQNVGDLEGKVRLLGRSRQAAVEAERGHFISRTEELTRENQSLRRFVDEHALEMEAKRVLVRQADELKVALAEERAEASGLRAITTHQAAELKEARAQWSQLQEQLKAREDEAKRLSEQVLAPLGADEAREGRLAELTRQLEEAQGEKEGLGAFQTSLFQETESLTAAYEKLSESTQRLKQQVEEKEKRNNRLQDELLKSKATEQMQVERASALERRQQDFERLRLEQAATVKELQELVELLRTQCAGLAQTRRETEEGAQADAEKLHQAQREADEAAQSLREFQNKLLAMTSRAEDLSRELDKVERERFLLREEVGSLTRKLQKVQVKIEPTQGAGAGGMGLNSATGGGREAAQNETLLKLLNCSVCNVRWKDCVITKCYHLFCQPCIQSNLKVRSRKCPACGKHFSENDVKPIFLT